MGDGTCPYCGHGFSAMPRRKQKCPVCHQDVFPRRRPSELDKRLVTEAEAAAIESEWTARQHRMEWLSRLSPFGVTDQTLDDARRDLDSRGASAFSESDVLWSILNRLVSDSLAGSDFSALRSLYFLMGLFSVEGGRESSALFRRSSEMALRSLQRSGVSRVAISTAGRGNACPECYRQNENEVSVEEAIRTLPLPHAACSSSYGYCRCVFVPA